MKYFVVADVHSFFNEMMTSLNKAGFDPTNEEHIFVSLGDLLDRGDYPDRCLEFVNGLQRKILIRGNHEDLIEDMIERGYCKQADSVNGTLKTACILTQLDYAQDVPMLGLLRRHTGLKQYLESLVDYAEVGNAVFVHGWIPRSEDWKNGDWADSRWYNGMEQWYAGVRVPGKTVVCGHWHTSWGNSYIHNDGREFGSGAKFVPFVDDGIVALDLCTTLTHKVACAVFNDNGEVENIYY